MTLLPSNEIGDGALSGQLIALSGIIRLLVCRQGACRPTQLGFLPIAAIAAAVNGAHDRRAEGGDAGDLGDVLAIVRRLE